MDYYLSFVFMVVADGWRLGDGSTYSAKVKLQGPLLHISQYGLVARTLLGSRYKTPGQVDHILTYELEVVQVSQVISRVCILLSCLANMNLPTCLTGSGERPDPFHVGSPESAS